MRSTRIILFLIICVPAFLFSQNRKKIDSLLLSFGSAQADTSKINSLNLLSIEFQKVDLDSARLFAKRALSMSVKNNYSSGKGFALNNIGSCYYMQSSLDTALIYYEQALVIREKLGNTKDIGRSLGNIGNIYYARANYDKANEYYSKQLDLAIIANNKIAMADGYGNVANVFMAHGDYGRSLDYNLRSLKIREDLNDTKGMDHSYNNIGGIYFAEGDYKKATEYINRSLQLQMSIGNKKGTADSYHNLGSIYYHLDSLERALEFFNYSLDIVKELGDKMGTANAYDNMGAIYIKTKQPLKAIDYQQKALQIFREVGNQKGEAVALNNLGSDFTEINNYSAAIQNLNASLVISKRIGAKDAIKNSYDYFVLLYKKIKDPKKALANYELSAAYGDSLLNEESANSIAEMQTKFDTEKKEKEIELLQKDKKLKDLALTAGDEKNRTLQTLIYVLLGGILLMGSLVLLVYRQNKQKRKNNELLENTNEELNRQKEITEQKNQLIMDSVDYAQTLIDLRLPTENELKKFFKGSVCLIQAADIIGGCMYALFQTENKIYVAVVDCRTQGIPGAFLALRAQQSFRLIMEDQNEIILSDAFIRFKNDLENNIGIKDPEVVVIEHDLKNKTLAIENAGMNSAQEYSFTVIKNFKEAMGPKVNEEVAAFRMRAEKQMRANSSGSDMILTAFWI